MVFIVKEHMRRGWERCHTPSACQKTQSFGQTPPTDLLRVMLIGVRNRWGWGSVDLKRGELNLCKKCSSGNVCGLATHVQRVDMLQSTPRWGTCGMVSEPPKGVWPLKWATGCGSAPDHFCRRGLRRQRFLTSQSSGSACCRLSLWERRGRIHQSVDSFKKYIYSPSTFGDG